MKLRIKPLIGEELTVDVDPNENILSIKKRIQELLEGYPSDQQRLAFQGKYLKNEKSIESYKLKDGNVLTLIKALRSAYTTRCSNTIKNLFHYF